MIYPSLLLLYNLLFAFVPKPESCKLRDTRQLPVAVSLLGTNLKREKLRVNIDSCHYPLTSKLHRSQDEEVNVSRKPRIVHVDRVESSRILSDDEPMFTRIYLPVSGVLRRLTEVSSSKSKATRAIVRINRGSVDPPARAGATETDARNFKSLHSGSGNGNVHAPDRGPIAAVSDIISTRLDSCKFARDIDGR